MTGLSENQMFVLLRLREGLKVKQNFTGKYFFPGYHNWVRARTLWSLVDRGLITDDQHQQPFSLTEAGSEQARTPGDER